MNECFTASMVLHFLECHIELKSHHILSLHIGFFYLTNMQSSSCHIFHGVMANFLTLGYIPMSALLQFTYLLTY